MSGLLKITDLLPTCVSYANLFDAIPSLDESRRRTGTVYLNGRVEYPSLKIEPEKGTTDNGEDDKQRQENPFAPSLLFLGSEGS